MAKSLKLTIELAGAEEIKAQLEGVGEAGEQAFDKIISKAKEVGGFKELDPAFLQQAFDELGTKAPEAIGKITQAVKSASRMETLINALTGVENGLAKIQTAATAVDNVLGKALVRSLTMVARLLPAAFAAATIGAIANTTNELEKLDAAAIKFGTSIETVSKLQEIFKAIGASASEASKGVGEFFASMETAKIEEVTKAVADIKKELASGWFGWEGFKTLERMAQGAGKAAELARQKLVELGRKVPVDEAAASIRELLAGTEDAAVKFEKLMEAFFKMGDEAKRNALILKTFGDELGTLIIRAMRAGLSMAELKELIGGIVPETKEATAAAIRLQLAWQRFKNFLASGFKVSPEGLDLIARALDDIIIGAQMVGEAISSAFGGDLLTNTIREFQTLVRVIGYVDTGLRAVFGSNIFDNTKRELETITGLLESLGKIGFAAMKYVELGAVTAWQTIIGWIDKAIDRLKAFFNAGGGKASGVGESVGAFARGGIMGGRGSGTSDSNLAWLSRGEHIMPASAVRQPGVLQLLEALRRSGGNLRGVLDRMGHFALGGLVGAPAFAAGGINGMSHVTIQFPGVQPIGGLRASSAVVDELRRSAALAQVRSGGRKPSRYT